MERPRDRLGPLKRREMAAFGHNNEGCSFDSVGHFAGQFRRRQRVVIANKDKSGHLDAAKKGACIAPPHDGPLLSGERRHAHLTHHAAHDALQRAVLKPVGMHEPWPKLRLDILEPPGFRRGDLAKAALPGVLRVGPRARVEEREPRHALMRGLTHGLQRNVATHRQSGERELLRRTSQKAACDRLHRIVARVVGDDDLDRRRKRINLG